jgi:hypothetical protein
VNTWKYSGSVNPLRVPLCAAITVTPHSSGRVNMRGSAKSARTTGTVCSPPVCASNGSFASAMRSQKRVNRRSLQLMFWQFGRHFIITAPAARQRSSSSSASGRAG